MTTIILKELDMSLEIFDDFVTTELLVREFECDKAMALVRFTQDEDFLRIAKKEGFDGRDEKHTIAEFIRQLTRENFMPCWDVWWNLEIK